MMSSEETVNSRSNNDFQLNINTSQTDESKVAEQQASFRLSAASKSRVVPLLADTGNYQHKDLPL